MGDVTAVGDEGGFAPNKLTSDEEAIEKILEAVKAAGFEPGKDFMIAMDAASSEWKSEKGIGYYKQPKSGKEFTSDELIAHWESLIDKYPIISIEDGLATIALRSAGYPGTGEYLEKLSSTAFFAASLMWSGVLKSGSPTLKLMTSTPWAFNSLLFWDMANVAEGDKRFRRSDN